MAFIPCLNQGTVWYHIQQQCSKSMKGSTDPANFKLKATAMSLFRHASIYVSGTVTGTSEAEMLGAKRCNTMFSV